MKTHNSDGYSGRIRTAIALDSDNYSDIIRTTIPITFGQSPSAIRAKPGISKARVNQLS